MVLSRRSIKRTREAGTSAADINDAIAEKHSDINVAAAREAGISDEEILESIKKKLEPKRGFIKDVGVQALAGTAAGAAAIPRTTALAAKGLFHAVTNPGETIVNFGRTFVGAEPIELEKEKPPLAKLIGTERAQKVKETIGFQAIEDLGKNFIDYLLDSSQGPYGRLSVEDLPSTKDARILLEDFFDVDLDPANDITDILSDGSETFVKNLQFGPGVAAAFGVGAMVKKTALKLGAPEFIANDLELISVIGANTKIAAKKPRVGKAFKEIDKKIDRFVNETKPLTKSKLTGELELNPRALIKNEPVVSLEPTNTIELSEKVAEDSRKVLFDRITPQKSTREGSVGKIKKTVNSDFVVERGKSNNRYIKVKNMIPEGSTLRLTAAQKELRKVEKNLEALGIPLRGESELRSLIEETRAEFGKTDFMSAKKAIVLKQKINNRLAFGIVDPGARKKAVQVLGPFKKRLGEGISKDILRISKSRLVAWREAERGHAAFAQKYGADAVVDLMNTKDLTKFGKNVVNGQVLDELNAVVGNSPIEKAALDRLVIEEIDTKGKTTRASRRDFDDLSKRLGPSAQQSGKELLDLNDPVGVLNKTDFMSQKIVEDVSTAIATGEHPKTTLNLMRTKKGHGIVKQTLRKTKEGVKALDAIENVFVDDVINGLFKGDVLDPSKMSKLLNNKELVGVVSDIAGSEFVDQLKGLQAQTKKIQRSFDKKAFAEKRPVAKVEPKPSAKPVKPVITESEKNAAIALSFLKTMGLKISSGVAIGAAATVGAAKIVKPIFSKAIRSESVRRLVKGIANQPTLRDKLVVKLGQEIAKIQKNETVKEG